MFRARSICLGCFYSYGFILQPGKHHSVHTGRIQRLKGIQCSGGQQINVPTSLSSDETTLRGLPCGSLEGPQWARAPVSCSSDTPFIGFFPSLSLLLKFLFLDNLNLLNKLSVPKYLFQALILSEQKLRELLAFLFQLELHR